MNLHEFLQYRTHCVCCGEPLKVKVNSGKEVSISNGCASFEVKLKAIKRGHKSYLTKFTILNATNDFCITFKPLKRDEEFMGYVPIHIINRLKQYFENAKCYIAVSCEHCKHYNYVSQKFEFNYKDGTVSDLIVEEENIFKFMVRNRNMWLRNRYVDQESYLYNPPDTQYLSSFHEITKLPLVKFTTLEETANRISKLLIFS